MFSLSTSSQSKTFQFDPSRGLDFENDIKVLRRSRLTKLSEFMTMLLSAERFQRDAKLSSLTRKDKNQLAQQAEDAQFFRILLRMLMEVSRASGLKQRDDLKKVYHWYQLNKEVLHCEPHFKGAGKQLYKRPELKFSADAIKFYSDPPGRRKNNQVTFQMTSQQSSPRGQGSDDFDDLRIDTSRPKTAPSGLNRPKIHNSLRSPRSGDDDASFAVNYINSYLNNHLSPMATKLDRPTSAMGVIRHAQIASQQRNDDEEQEALGDEQSAHSQAASLASDSNISILVPNRRQDGEEKKDENGDDGSVKMEDDGEDPADGEKKEEGPGLFKRKPPLTSLVNPVAQATFEEESFHGSLPPEISEGTLLRVQVDMPKAAVASKQPPGLSEAEKKAAYLQQWHDYQQQQGMTAGDGAPSGDEGERVVTTEVPERFTQEVLVNYATQESFVTDNAPHIPANSLASQSLENFYKMTENHEPKVDQNPISTQSALRLHKAQEVKKVTIAEETSSSTRQRALSARTERPSSVQAGSLVILADHVGDNMMVEKEPNGPETPAGFRRPSSKIPPKRPATAPSSKPVSVSVPNSYRGMSPPPNSSGDSTPEYTPRNRKGEPIFTLPEESEYNVHFRRQGQTPVSATIPHSISRLQGNTVPDSARYKWRDDGYGHMTYRKVHSRIQSAPAQRTSLRTAGSTRGGNRPRTASEASAKKKWHPCKVCEDSIRLPQAASHRMRTMHPATVASMMSIKTLEGDNRRMRSRMGHRHTGTYPWEEEPVTGNMPPNMQYMSISTPAAIKVRNATDGSKAPNQSTESLVPKDSLRSPSRDSSHPSPVQGWFMGDSSAGETTTVADGPPSNQGGDNNSSTVMAPSERSFGEMSDVDLADLTDQTLSPADTPRTIDSGDYRPKSRVDLSVGNSSGGFGQEIHVPQADIDSGSPDLATKEAEDSVEGTPRLDVGNSSVGDTPRSSSSIGQAESPEVTSSETTPRETIVKGEPDQTGSEQLQLEEAASKSAEAEDGPTVSEENGAKQEESNTEQDAPPSVTHSFKAQAVESRPSSSSSSTTIHAMSDHAHSFVPVEKHEKTSNHHQRQHAHPHGNHHQHPPQDGHRGAKVVSLDLDVHLHDRCHSPASTNTPHNVPTAYMKLSEGEKKKLKGTHPTAATNIPEYLLMMPAVSSKPLTPHSSRPTTPRSATSRSPRVSPATSPCPRYSRSPSPSFRSRSPSIRSPSPSIRSPSPSIRSPSPSIRSPSPSIRSPSPSIRSPSPSIRTPSPGSVNGRLSPNLKTSPQGCDSLRRSRSPSPTLSPASQSLRPKSARSRVTSARQQDPPPSDTVKAEEIVEVSDQGGAVEDGERGSTPVGLVSESMISITAEDEEVSAITDTYDDLGIIDDDGVSLSPCTPDNFSQQDGLSSGATSPSITITMATSDQPSTVPQILVKRPSSAPGIRTDEGHSSLGLSAEGGNGGDGGRPSSARGRRPVSARRAASPQPRRPTSPRPTSPRFTRPVSPRSNRRGSQWEGRPVPAFGHSNPEAEYESYQKQQEAKNSVQIQKLFNKSSTKEAKKRLGQAEKARQEKMGREAFESERAYLEHLWRREVALYKRDDITFKNFEKDYMLNKLNRSKLRQEKRNMLLQEQAAENRRQMALLKRIGPSVDIHELFNAQSRGVSKAVMKRAAISIQRFVRGMIIRKMLAKVKEKSRIHAGSFKSFIKYYYNLMKKIARWHGVKKPRIHLDLWQMEEFMDKKKYYEYIFSKRIHPETQMPAKDLPSYLMECDHHPSQREINNAILGATKKDFTKPNLMLKEREVSEIVFMIYVPRGTGLEAKNVRKSTWLNPLVDGEEARKMMGTDEVKNVELSKSLQLVFNSMQERKEQKMYEDRIRKREEEKKRLEMEEQEKEREEQEKKLDGEGKGEEKTDERKERENESEVTETGNEKE